MSWTQARREHATSPAEQAADSVAIAHAGPDLATSWDTPHGGTIQDAVTGVQNHLGVDLSHVSIRAQPLHGEPRGTLARTRGSTIDVTPHALRPDLPIGQALLAHELTHVVQQTREATAPEGVGTALREAHQRVGTAPPGMSQRTLMGCKEAEEVEQTPKESPAPTPERKATDAAAPKPASPAKKSGTDPLHTPVKIAGAATPTKPFMVIRVAWTSDDGPTPSTVHMKDPEKPGSGALGGIPSTWYIQKKHLTKARMANLVRLQAAGDEVAIHSAHPTIDHAAWFPVDCPSAPKGYKTMAESLTALETFTTELRAAGLKIRFVRIPTGLLSELTCYLSKKGVSSANSVARKIVKGQAVTGAAATVKADYDALVAKLKTLKLHLWGGSGSGKISTQSWEAQSAPPGGSLIDDVGHRDPSKKNHVQKRRFKALVDGYDPSKGPGGKNRPRSLVILTHDTAKSYADEVRRDVAHMEDYAASKGVQIQYFTMSAMYKAVVGRNP